MIAAVPLIGCGADPSAPHNLGGDGGDGGAGSAGAGGSTASHGGAGNPSFSGAPNASHGGAGGGPSFGGNSSFGGAPAAGGSLGSTGGAPAAGGASAGAAGGTVIDPNDPAGPIGDVSLYPLGSFKIAGNIYFMGHDAGGLYAMTMACTHAGCACDMKGTELSCPCHGSRFDHAGNVLQGPATKPLPHFKVSVDASGNIAVDRFTVVSQSTRTPV